MQFGDTLTLAGLDFVVRNEGDDAYGVEIPALNVIYIHMMGSTTHSILTSIDHIRAFQSELECFHYALVLTAITCRKAWMQCRQKSRILARPPKSRKMQRPRRISPRRCMSFSRTTRAKTIWK